MFIKIKKTRAALVCCLNFFCFFILIFLSIHSVDAKNLNENFIIVKIKKGETLSNLADKYLDDNSKGWIIAEFNNIKAPTPGQTIIIPLKPFKLGGLKPDGYQTVPVLVYNKLSENSSNRSVVNKTSFEEQMRYLKDNGFSVITISQLVNFLDFKEQIPEKSVVISMDKGWKSVYNIAYPILKKYKYPATLFVCTDFIGKKEALSWKQIKEMSKNGINIECNSKTYRNMAELKNRESFKEYLKALANEILISKKLIQQKLSKQCNYIAYPYGKTNNLIIALLRKYGYHAAFTTKCCSNPFFINNYLINRSVIYGNYDIKDFKKKIAVFSERNLK